MDHRSNAENAVKPFVIGWTDYENEYFPSCELTDEIYEAVAYEVRAKGYRFGGDSHQDSPACCPVLNNGFCARFSRRGWGLVVAMAYDLRSANGEYDHMCGYADEMLRPQAIIRPEAFVDFVRLQDNGKSYQIVASPSQYDNHWIKKFEARIDSEDLKHVKVGDYLEIRVFGKDKLPFFMDRYKVTAIFRAPTFEEALDRVDGRYYTDSEYFGYPDDLEEDGLIEQFYRDYPRDQVEGRGVVLFRIASYRE